MNHQSLNLTLPDLSKSEPTVSPEKPVHPWLKQTERPGVSQVYGLFDTFNFFEEDTYFLNFSGKLIRPFLHTDSKLLLLFHYL